MILYINESADNVIGKVLKRVGDVTVRLPATIDVIKPVIKLNGFFEEFNYCEIPELERFYFVKSKQVRGKIVELFLEVDVLETYKHVLKGLSCEVEVGINRGDYGRVVGEPSLESESVFINGVDELFDDETIILVTIGGGRNG